MTAAHCALYTDLTRTIILVGDQDITTAADTPWAAAYRLSRLIVHPGFTYETSLNDIALAQTQTYIRFKYVRTSVFLRKYSSGN